jgi:pyruvate/2-oxoglutarate dehydrogenase complex dihydrolipoamide acyltransferase (E2) component
MRTRPISVLVGTALVVGLAATATGDDPGTADADVSSAAHSGGLSTTSVFLEDLILASSVSEAATAGNGKVPGEVPPPAPPPPSKAQPAPPPPPPPAPEPAPAPAPPPPPPPAPTPPPPPAAPGSIDDILARHFGAQAATAKRVAACESGLNPGAVSPGGGNHGLFQINSVHQGTFQSVTGAPWSGVYDAELNTIFAKWLYDQQGWGPWACA